MLTCAWSCVVCDGRKSREGPEADKRDWTSVISQECLGELDPWIEGCFCLSWAIQRIPDFFGIELICKVDFLHTYTLWWESKEYPWVGLCRRHMEELDNEIAALVLTSALPLLGRDPDCWQQPTQLPLGALSAHSPLQMVQSGTCRGEGAFDYHTLQAGHLPPCHVIPF